MRKATEKQLALLDDLGVEYDEDISIQEASSLISAELELIEENSCYYAAEDYGDRD